MDSRDRGLDHPVCWDTLLPRQAHALGHTVMAAHLHLPGVLWQQAERGVVKDAGRGGPLAVRKPP